MFRPNCYANGRHFANVYRAKKLPGRNFLRRRNNRTIFQSAVSKRSVNRDAGRNRDKLGPQNRRTDVGKTIDDYVTRLIRIHTRNSCERLSYATNASRTNKRTAIPPNHNEFYTDAVNVYDPGTGFRH